MIKRKVLKINKEHKVEKNGVTFYELNIDVLDSNTTKTVDVLLCECEMQSIRENGYYMC